LGIREFMKRRQSVTTILACVMIVGGAVAIYLQVREMSSSSGPGKAFFTVDDGKSYFVDDARKLAPFDRDGRKAVRAHVFECGGKREVGYLSCYAPEALKAMEEAKAVAGTGRPPPNVHVLANIGTMGTLVKRPGEANWVSQADAPRATAIRVFRCRDGSTALEIDP
jgi:hypothetical protein